MLALLEAFDIALLLELLGFEEVAGVVFVRNGQRHEVQALDALQRRALAAHRHHLQEGFLRAVVGVLGTPLALGNPDVLALLGNGVVHILAQLLAARQFLTYGSGTLHDERLVDAHQRADPGTYEQVVAYGYLNRCGETVRNQ